MRNSLTNIFNKILCLVQIFGYGILLQSCITGEENPLIADCQKGWSFNTIARKCEEFIMPPAAPLAISKSFSIDEDSRENFLELVYEDDNKDLASECKIYEYSETIDGNSVYPPVCECRGGRCFVTIWPDFEFFGEAQFTYSLTDINGTSDIQLATVTVVSKEDTPVAEMDRMDEEILNVALLNNGVTIEDNFGVINYNSYIEEGQRKTIYLWGEDYDFDPVSACQVANISDHLEVDSLCTCEEDLFGIGSLCQVDVIARTNFFGTGEFITYQVFSSGDWSEAETHFLEIKSINDPPVICHFSLYDEAMECSKGDKNDDCVGTEKPTINLINPISHTDERPVIFLDEERGECFRSIDLGASKYWLGHLEDSLNFGDDVNGGVVNGSGDLVEYPFGAKWITVEEGSSLNIINLKDAIDVDFLFDEGEDSGENDNITALKYFTIENTHRGLLRHCLSNDNHGEIEFAIDELTGDFLVDDEGYLTHQRSEDLSCVYDIKFPNKNFQLNNNHLYDTAAIGNAQNSPTLRFVAKQKGDLAKVNSAGRICVKYVGGNTNGAASVDVDLNFFDEIEQSYCENFPYDVLDTNNLNMNTCEEFGLHRVELDLETDLFMKINSKLDVNIANGIDLDDRSEDTFFLKLTYPDGNPFLELMTENLPAGFDETSVELENIVEYAFSENEEGQAYLYLKNKTLDKIDSRLNVYTDDLMSAQYESAKVSKLNPFWRYDCGDDKGGSGRLLTIKIDDEVTTTQTIKNAILSHPLASSLVDVYMYGSLREEVTAQDEEDKWPRTLGGGREYLDYFTYVAEDTFLEFNNELALFEIKHSLSNLGRVYIDITPTNDAPSISTNGIQDLGRISVEDGAIEFELDLASDADFRDNLKYYISDLPENGTLTGCANLEGSDGLADLTCVFTPDPNYNGEITISYYAEDEGGLITSNKQIEFDINSSNDNPVVCQYSIFEEANECGVKDCIHQKSPVGRIIPKSHTAEKPIYFYQKEKAICYKSTGNGDAYSWEEVSEHIADVYVNQSQEIRITNIRVDEGGGGGEDSQVLVLTNVEVSGDTDLIPLSNINLSYEPKGEKNANDGTWTFGAATSEDEYDFVINIIPRNSISGSATITLTFDDGGETIHSSFNVRVFESKLIHHGWKNIKAIAPRLSGSPYCDDNGLREQSHINFLPAIFSDGNTIQLFTDNTNSETFTFKNGAVGANQIEINGLEKEKIIQNAAQKINNYSSFEAWEIGSRLHVKDVNPGDLPDSIVNVHPTYSLKVIDGIDTQTTDSKTCVDRGGSWYSGRITQSPNVCSYSQTKCNGGEKCVGNVSPDSVTPDEFNAIYRQNSSVEEHLCYRARGAKTINNLTFSTKLAGVVVIEMKLDGAEGSEWVEILDENVGCDIFGANDTFYKNNPAGIVHYVRVHAHQNSDNDDLAQRIVGDGDMDCSDGDASCLLDVSFTNAGYPHGINEGQYFISIGDFSYQNVGDILLVGFENNLSVEFRDNDSVNPTVSFVDKKLLVAMDNKDSERCEVVDKINNHSDARNYIVAIDLGNQNEGEAEDILEIGNVVSIPPTNFLNGQRSYQWESFSTHCNITESDLMPSCRENYLLGASCLGYITPNIIDDHDNNVNTFTREQQSLDNRFQANRVIPLEFNQFYQDLNSKKCYRSDVVDINPDSDGDGDYKIDHEDEEDEEQYRFVSYTATGATTLEWEDFTLSDGQIITGYEVYRKLGGVLENALDVRKEIGDGAPDEVVDGLTDLSNNTKFFNWDYTSPVNITTLPANAKSFTDDAVTTRHPPVPGTVYFYEVRPIVNNIISKAQEDHRRVRIMSPPENFAFVHRWMVNKKICDLMHADTRQDVVNPEFYEKKGMDDYFKCLYYGPGAKIPGFDNYYDIAHDMLVMQTEAGCPYTRNGCKGGSIYEDGNCIGVTNPNDAGVEPKNLNHGETVFYNRENAKCMVWHVNASDEEGQWQSYDFVKHPTIYFTNSLNPPLTKLDSSNYKGACSSNLLNVINTNTLGVVSVDIRDGLVHSTPIDSAPTGEKSNVKDQFFDSNQAHQVGSLPNRMEQIAYSLWDLDTYSHSEINTLETGLSLNSSSKCNSSEASGVEDGYTDTESPGVNLGFSMPGTYSSQIRSVQTGSELTKNCQSVFGIQDAVGNVSEYSIDSFSDNPDFSLVTILQGETATSDVSFIGPTAGKYQLNNPGNLTDVDGPCPDVDGNETCWENGEDFESWVIDTEANKANNMYIPYGLPVANNYANSADESFSSFTFEIGPTNGITSEALHDDEWIFNTADHLNAASSSNAAILCGGSYENGSGAGVWFMELVKPTSSRTDVGFRCIFRLYEENYFETQYGNSTPNH